MMLSAWPWLLAMPSRPGPADAHDALAEGDAHADVVLVMPSRPRQADAHDALGVALALGDAFKARAS